MNGDSSGGPSLDDPYRIRRALLARHMREAGGGVALVMTAPEVMRNGDSEHAYRHDSYFHYLTGFDEPHSGLVLRADGHSVLFCREKDPALEIWNGYRLGVQAAPQALGVDEALAIEQLDARMPDLLQGQPAVWTLFGAAGALEQRLAGWLAALRERSHLGSVGPGAHRNLALLLDDMRLVKSAQELDTMRRAATISAGAHARAMRYCAQRFRADPAALVREYEIAAELLHEVRRTVQRPGLHVLVAAAPTPACCTTRRSTAQR